MNVPSARASLDQETESLAWVLEAMSGHEIEAAHDAVHTLMLSPCPHVAVIAAMAHVGYKAAMLALHSRMKAKANPPT